MTPKQLFEAIGQIDDDLITGADLPQSAPARRKAPRLRYWQSLAAAAACVCIAVGAARAAGFGKMGTALSSAAPEAKAAGQAAEAADDSALSSAAAAEAPDESAPAPAPYAGSTEDAAAAPDGGADENGPAGGALADGAIQPLSTLPIPADLCADGWVQADADALAQGLSVRAGVALLVTDADGGPLAPGVTLTVTLTGSDGAPGEGTLLCSAPGGAAEAVPLQEGRAALTAPEGEACYFCLLPGADGTARTDTAQP